jgi:hypothetical protein
LVDGFRLTKIIVSVKYPPSCFCPPIPKSKIFILSWSSPLTCLSELSTRPTILPIKGILPTQDSELSPEIKTVTENKRRKAKTKAAIFRPTLFFGFFGSSSIKLNPFSALISFSVSSPKPIICKNLKQN